MSPRAGVEAATRAWGDSVFSVSSRTSEEAAKCCANGLDELSRSARHCGMRSVFVPNAPSSWPRSACQPEGDGRAEQCALAQTADAARRPTTGRASI
jgi:hypothetical protein